MHFLPFISPSLSILPASPSYNTTSPFRAAAAARARWAGNRLLPTSPCASTLDSPLDSHCRQQRADVLLLSAHEHAFLPILHLALHVIARFRSLLLPFPTASVHFLDPRELYQLADVTRRHAAASHDLQSAFCEFAHLFDCLFALHDGIALQGRAIGGSTPPEVRMRSTPRAMQSYNDLKRSNEYASRFEKINRHIDSAMERNTTLVGESLGTTSKVWQLQSSDDSSPYRPFRPWLSSQSRHRYKSMLFAVSDFTPILLQAKMSSIMICICHQIDPIENTSFSL